MSAPQGTQAPRTGITKFLDVIQPFVIGGVSGMFATCIIQPVDMIKVTIQLKSEEAVNHKASISPFSVAREIFEAEGMRGFYRGYLYKHIDSILLWPDRSFIPPPGWAFTRPLLRTSRNKTKEKTEVKILGFRGIIHVPKSLLCTDRRIHWFPGGKSCWSCPCQNASWCQIATCRKEKL